MSREKKPVSENAKMRREYRTGIAVAILLALITALVLGLVFGLGSTAKDERIKQLETIVNHNAAELMDVMMHGLTFSTRYMQNGTVVFGYVREQGDSATSLADFNDYVILNYTLKEVFLTQASVPLTVLEISATPRPIVFTPYIPAILFPRQNHLEVTLSLFQPPIAQLDAQAANYLAMPYSYVTASKIVISPNCVAMSSSQQDSLHCRPEAAYSTYQTPFNAPQSFYLYSAFIGAGNAALAIIWGQWSYASFANQYDFVGTSVEFTAPLQLLIAFF